MHVSSCDQLTVVYITNLLTAEVCYVLVARGELYALIALVVGGTCTCVNV